MATFTCSKDIDLQFFGLELRISQGTVSCPDDLVDEIQRLIGDAFVSNVVYDRGRATTLGEVAITGIPATGQILTASSSVAATWATPATPTATFSRGGTLIQSDGLTAASNIIVWRAPFACTVTAVKGYRVGGSGATVNARRNGSSNHLSSAVSLASADTWTDGGAVQNTAYSAGDKLEIMIVSVTGSPTQVAVQIDFTKP